jgi:hypothetical protein
MNTSPALDASTADLTKHSLRATSEGRRTPFSSCSEDGSHSPARANNEDMNNSRDTSERSAGQPRNRPFVSFRRYCLPGTGSRRTNLPDRISPSGVRCVCAIPRGHCLACVGSDRKHWPNARETSTGSPRGTCLPQVDSRLRPYPTHAQRMRVGRSSFIARTVRGDATPGVATGLRPSGPGDSPGITVFFASE